MAPFLPFVHTPEQLEGVKAQPGAIGSKLPPFVSQLLPEPECPRPLKAHVVPGRHTAATAFATAAGSRRGLKGLQPPKFPLADPVAHTIAWRPTSASDSVLWKIRAPLS